MKLIDLLVQELPKRGWWKENWEVVTQDANGYFCCWRYDDPKYNGFGWRHRTGKGLVGYWRVDNDVVLSCDSTDSIVTRNQYESALIASQNSAWNGEGIPPVGCECEYLDNNGKWYPVTVKYASDQLVIISGVIKILGEEQETEIAKDIIIDKPQFRPLRTEAERKRDAAIEAMQKEADEGDNWIYSEYEIIYDAIAAGKIPGVKLDD